MSRAAVVLALVLAGGVAGCGGSNSVSPAEVAQNYVYAIAEGNYPGACALLDATTRERLVSSMGSRIGCPRLFARCLPKHSRTSKTDQTQLLYANVDPRIDGARADVRLTGTLVANATKEVLLVRHRAHWGLTSPGRAITRCLLRSRRGRGHRHRRRPAGG